MHASVAATRKPPSLVPRSWLSYLRPQVISRAMGVLAASPPGVQRQVIVGALVRPSACPQEGITASQAQDLLDWALPCDVLSALRSGRTPRSLMQEILRSADSAGFSALGESPEAVPPLGPAQATQGARAFGSSALGADPTSCQAKGARVLGSSALGADPTSCPGPSNAVFTGYYPRVFSGE